MKAYFDSRVLTCKNPFGAVKSGEKIQFRITVFDDVFVNCIFLVLQNGNRYAFSYDKSENAFSSYRLELVLDEPGVYYYYFLFDTENGFVTGKNQNGRLVLDETAPLWQLTVYDREFTVPEWAKGAIMYQIFPDRFCKSERFTPLPAKNERKVHKNWEEVPDFIYQKEPYRANDYFCGNLCGITERLDDIAALGVSVIYLNPIFESSENHRYSTGDYHEIDPYLGTKKDFLELIQECKKRGIHVILDGVFSHTGADSVYFNQYGNYLSEGAYQSMESPYYSWYSFRQFPDVYDSWWGFRNLPNVKEDSPSYLDFITNPKTGVLKYWHDFGIDGWRLDVADELPDVFIDTLRQTVKELNPQALVLGEVWEDASNKESYGVKRRYLLGKQLDSVMNYPFRSAIIEYLKTNRGDVFSEAVIRIAENYPEEVLQVMMNPLGTHDTKRIMTELGVRRKIAPENQGDFRMTQEEYENARELLKLAIVLQFTLPGMPSIYYGDEAGVQGFRDPYCRTTYPYGHEDEQILSFYREITALHQKYRLDFLERFTQIECSDGVLYYRRGKLKIYINAGEQAAFYRGNVVGELVYYQNHIAYNEFGMILPPKSFAILKEDTTNE